MATILPNSNTNSTISNFNQPSATATAAATAATFATTNQDIALVSALAFDTHLRATSEQIRNGAKGPAKSSIDPYPDLPRLVDIAGEKYSFDRQRISGIELFMKPYEDFLINFGLKNGNSGDPYYYEFLVRAYLPYGVQMKVGSFSFEETKHLDDLIKLLERRISRLRESSAVNMTQTNLKRSHNAILLKNYQTLKLFLQDWHQAPTNQKTQSRNDLLKKAETLTDKIPGVKLIITPSKQEAVKIRQNLINLSDEKKMEMIFRLMFYALHPDKLDINILREWQTLLNWSKNAGPKDFFQELVTATKNSPKQPATPLNYLERINAHKLAQSKNQESAVREFKESLIRLNSSEEAERTQAISSLKRLLLVLAQKNYISQNTTEVPTEMAKKLDDEIMTRLPASTNPLFQTLKKFYDPLYQEVINIFDSDPSFQESLNKSQEENGLLVNFLDLYENFTKFQEESAKLKNSELIRLNSDSFKINDNLWKFLLAIIKNTNFMNYQHTLEKQSQHVLAFPNTFSIANPPLDNYTNIDKNTLEEFLGMTPKNQWVFFLPPFQEVPTDNSSYFDWSSTTGATKIFTIAQSLETVTVPDRTGKTLSMEVLRIILIVLYQKALEGRIKTEMD